MVSRWISDDLDYLPKFCRKFKLPKSEYRKLDSQLDDDDGLSIDDINSSMYTDSLGSNSR
eukprot:735992-Hanusia_phi.AAC.2